jgi:hypothetical protein
VEKLRFAGKTSSSQARRTEQVVDGSFAASENFVVKSTNRVDAVDRPPQNVHSTVDAALARVHDLEMLAALVAAATLVAPPTLDPQHLPKLPQRGLVRETATGALLETMRGRPLGILRNLHVASRRGTHGVLLQDRTAAVYTIDLFERRVRRVYPMNLPGPRGCTFTDATVRVRLFVCGRKIEATVAGRTRVVARGRGGLGSWSWAEFSPDGKAILAQWSGECESPAAYVIVRGRVRSFGRSAAVESVGLGWLPDGRAIVNFWSGICGAGIPTPGVYAVPLRGKPELLRRMGPRPSLLAMWGG